MHLSVSWHVTIGLKDSCKVGRGGGGNGCVCVCVKWRLTDPLYLMIWGPRVPAFWLCGPKTHSRLWKAALLWDRQHSPSGSNITVTHTSTSRVIRIQKSGCITQYQTESNVHPFLRSALWECANTTRTGFCHGWNILLIKFQVWILHKKESKTTTWAVFKCFCAILVFVRRGLFNPWHFSSVEDFFFIYI